MFQRMVIWLMGPRVASLSLTSFVQAVSFLNLGELFDKIVLISVEKSEKQNWRASNDWKRPKFLHTSIVQDKSKVTVISWSPDGQHVAAGTEEGLAKLFAFDKAKLKSKYYHTTHADKAVQDSRKKIEALCWTNDETIVTGDALGNLVVWNHQAQNYKCLNFGRHQIQVIKSQSDELIAIGCRHGLVLIVSINSAKIIHKIRCSEEDIQGLAWAKDQVFEPELNRYLLAVSSRSKVISVWCGQTSTQIANLKPKTFTTYPSKDKKHEPFLTCSFGTVGNCIFFTGPQGEVYKWDLTKLSKTAGASSSAQSKCKTSVK